MPRRKPFALTGSAELDVMVERAAPSVLGLLADGTPPRTSVSRWSGSRSPGGWVETGGRYTPGDDGPSEAA